MLGLKEFRQKIRSLSDLLPYALLVDNGIILNKDGSFLAGWEYTGLDTASATHHELAYVSQQVSNATKHLGTGFMLHIDAVRSHKKAYPPKEKSHFPDKISQLIDDERRDFFGSDVCFSTRTIIVLTYKPEYGLANKSKQNANMEKYLEYFKNHLLMFEDALASVLHMNRLEEYEIFYNDRESFLQSDLLAHIQCCITGELNPTAVPSSTMYLDSLLASEDFLGGIAPKIGEQNLCILSIDGLPQESYPVMMSCFDSLPFKLRLNTRFICLGQYEAEQEISKYSKGWNQQILRFIDQFIDNPKAKINRDAFNMREDAEEAKTEVQSGLVGAGYMSISVVMMDLNSEKLTEQAREIRRMVQTLGFGCRIETINAVEAYLGTLPGIAYANLRRPLVTTLNLADFLPLSTVYTGQANCPSPFFPSASRPLAVLTTEYGTTPFWFNLHVGDLGHTLIFGPTGSGKSTLLAFIASQFPCYKNANVFAFDKGMSLFPLCTAVGGSHFEIGEANILAFAPLANVGESKAEMAWCEEWIETLLVLQGITVTPKHRNYIHDAMVQLGEEKAKNYRSLSDFTYVVQSHEIKEALKHYTNSGSMGHLLDAKEDNLSLSAFIVFEIEELMNMGDKNLIPVLLYLFHRIEKALQGQPVLLILDEAWIMLSNKVFRAKIREWLKVLRKANCAVVLATQSLSDAKNSGILDVLSESCPTKIFLANPNANQEEQAVLYKNIGLNDRELEIISREATPKRDYYISSSQGKRLTQLALGRKTLAFVGSSDKESIKRIKQLTDQYGQNEWQEYWLKEKLGE